MIRTLCLVLLAGAVLAGTPEDDAWEGKVLAQLAPRAPELARIEQGQVRKHDLALIQLLAAYGGFKAARFSPEARRRDSLAEGVERFEGAFYHGLRPWRENIDRLAAGGRARAEDSTLIRVLAAFAGSKLAGQAPLELGR